LVVSEVLDEDQRFGLVVWYDENSRSDPAVINRTILDTPSGRRVALGQVVEVLDTSGPNTLNSEGVQRRIVVFCNVQGRDLGGVVEDIHKALAPVEERLRKLPGNYRIDIGGQYEAQQRAHERLRWLVPLAVAGIFLLLWKCLGSWVAAMQVLVVNIPLAALGSVAILLVLNRPDWAALRAADWWQWPRIWARSTTLSVAHWVGFITLIGIVSRNGILMISHYIHLMKHEGEKFDEHMIIRGSLERLAPVLMTAFVAMIGLVPLGLGAGQTGKELLHPLAVVVIGGLLDSTLMDQVVTPAIFLLFGKLYISWFGSNPYLNEEGGALEQVETERWADSLFPSILTAANRVIEPKIAVPTVHAPAIVPLSPIKEIADYPGQANCGPVEKGPSEVAEPRGD
jgi:Cu/Ag efflux pump CusA